MILLGIDEVSLEEEFPESVYFHIAVKTGLRISSMDHDMTQVAIGPEIHVEDRQAATNPLIFYFPAVDDLRIAGHLQDLYVPDLQSVNDHTRHENAFFDLFLDDEACECEIMDVSMEGLREEGMLKIGRRGWRDAQTGGAVFLFSEASDFLHLCRKNQFPSARIAALAQAKTGAGKDDSLALPKADGEWFIWIHPDKGGIGGWIDMDAKDRGRKIDRIAYCRKAILHKLDGDAIAGMPSDLALAQKISFLRQGNGKPLFIEFRELDGKEEQRQAILHDQVKQATLVGNVNAAFRPQAADLFGCA